MAITDRLSAAIIDGVNCPITHTEGKAITYRVFYLRFNDSTFNCHAMPKSYIRPTLSHSAMGFKIDYAAIS